MAKKFVTSFIIVVVFTFNTSVFAAQEGAVGGANPTPQAVGGANPTPQAVGGANPTPQVVSWWSMLQMILAL